MSTSCHGLLETFVRCLRESDCIKKDNKAVTQCAKDAKECAGLRYSYYQCKRGQLDNRNRITGNKGY